MLAYELGRSIEDVEQMGLEEYKHWMAFFKIVNEKRAKEQGLTPQRGGRRGYKPG